MGRRWDLQLRKQPDPRPCSRKDSQRDQGEQREGRPRVSGGWGVGRRGQIVEGGNWKESGGGQVADAMGLSGRQGDEEGQDSLQRVEVT